LQVRGGAVEGGQVFKVFEVVKVLKGDKEAVKSLAGLVGTRS
jgi:hypothetical protein